MIPTDSIRKRRLFISLLLVTILFSILAARLFYIQLAAARSFTSRKVDLIANSVLQRGEGIILDSGRGNFYDRGMHPLTGNMLQVLVVFPVDGDFQPDSLQNSRLARILNTAPETWAAFIKHLDSPKIWTGDSDEAADRNTGASRRETPVNLTDEQVRQITALAQPNLKIAQYRLRYSGDQIARHVIGFISQNPERITNQFIDQVHKGELQLTSKIGGSGLEKTLETWLKGIGPTSISLFTDAKKRPLDGLDARIVSPDNEFYPLKAVTTLSAGIQKQIEDALDRQHIHEGAVVVLDASNADVVAMASRPQFDPNHIDLAGGNWANKALKATIPGSIFKTVVAAAALEEKAASPDDTFDCQGALGKYGFTCWKEEGHGHISLREAFAQSCNIAFGKLMQRLSGEQLEKYAKKLGLATQVGWKGPFLDQSGVSQWDAEEKGQIFAAGTQITDEGVLMQTAIGQRDVRVTPLQAANLVVTLLNQGEVKSPRVVQSMLFQNDRLLGKFQEHTLIPGRNGISAKTAKQLLAWMTDVVDYGTGKALQQARWHVAGKSGTAQVKTGPDSTDNQWFIGYGPVEQPRYAVAVVVQNVPASGRNKSLPLFQEVMDILSAQ
jgi:cell division protein FtsI/penicillin-binding protein 2